MDEQTEGLSLAYNDSTKLYVKCDESTNQFSMGGIRLTVDEVIDSDNLGQLKWVSPQTRDWVYKFASHEGAGAAATLVAEEPKPPTPPTTPRIQPAVASVEDGWKAPISLTAGVVVKLAGAAMVVLWFLWLMGRMGWLLALVVTIPSMAVLPAIPFAMWVFDGVPNGGAFVVWAVGMVAYAVSRATRSQRQKTIEGIRRAVGGR
jgi:hypothetical protein